MDSHTDCKTFVVKQSRQGTVLPEPSRQSFVSAREATRARKVDAEGKGSFLAGHNQHRRRDTLEEVPAATLSLHPKLPSQGCPALAVVYRHAPVICTLSWPHEQSSL